MERAQARAEEYGIPKACTVDELLADPEIEIVVNLTIPKAHAEVALKAAQAGKSVYNEKPLAVEREEGRRCWRWQKARGFGRGSARHVSGRRAANVPQADRRRLDRRARGGHRLYDVTRATRAGIRTPTSTTSRAAARCLIWDRTISPRSSR